MTRYKTSAVAALEWVISTKVSPKNLTFHPIAHIYVDWSQGASQYTHMPPYRYKSCHYKDNTAVGPSNWLYSRASYLKRPSLYWNRAGEVSSWSNHTELWSYCNRFPHKYYAHLIFTIVIPLYPHIYHLLSCFTIMNSKDPSVVKAFGSFVFSAFKKRDTCVNWFVNRNSFYYKFYHF